MKRSKVLAIVMFVNVIVLTVLTLSGIKEGDPSFRFQEKQAGTFISALLMILSGVFSFLIHYVLKLSGRITAKSFWFFAGFGLIYLGCDDYFMMHEGIDDAIGEVFFNYHEKLEFDGFIIGLFGLCSMLVCWIYRQQIFMFQKSLWLIRICPVLLVLYVFFDYAEKFWGAPAIVIKESIKIITVSIFLVIFMSNYNEALDDVKKMINTKER